MKRAVPTLVAALLLAGCGSSSPSQSTPAGALKIAYQAVEDGRYQAACDVMYDVGDDCTQRVAEAAALARGMGGDSALNGIGDVRVDADQIEYSNDQREATIPIAALSWPGGRSYPFLTEDTLRLEDGKWLVNSWG